MQLYFLAISTVLKLKGRYPLKPVGINIFRKLEEIAESIEETLTVVENEDLRFLYTNLKRISVLAYEASCIEEIFSIVRNVASIISGSYSSENEAKRALELYVLSLKDDRDIVSQWIFLFQKKIYRWLPKIFRYVSFPFLPNTNNDLEAFNLKIKKLYRHITGRKNSHRFLFSSGVPISHALSTSFNLSAFACSQFSHQEITLQKEFLFDLKKKSLEYSIKTNLSEFLSHLEVISKR